MRYKYTEAELTDYFYKALDLFNEKLDTDMNRDTVKVRFFNPQNGLDVYKSFCQEFFPNQLEDVDAEYFNFIAAEAFQEEDSYGVLIREDIDYEEVDVIFTFLHEISHMFCTKNEIPTGDFYNRYCQGNGIHDGYLNAGYAIWREAVADIMADSILSEYSSLSLFNLDDELNRLYQLVISKLPNSKKSMSLIIVYVMISKEVCGETEWNSVVDTVESVFDIKDKHLMSILKLVFENIHQNPFWRITPDFIEEVGTHYISILTNYM